MTKARTKKKHPRKKTSAATQKGHPRRQAKSIRGAGKKHSREKKRDKSSTARQYEAQSIGCRAMLMIR